MTDVKTVDPGADTSQLHVGVAVASWNKTITHRLLEGAIEQLRELGVGKVTVLEVPGSLELPIGALALTRAGCHAVVALGAVIKGDTDHYSVVVNESARGLTLVAHESGVPVTNGILAVHDVADAVERAQSGPSNKGNEAATAAVEMALLLAGLEEPART